MSRVARSWTVWLLAAVPLLAQAPATPRLRVEREVFVRGGSSTCLAWSPDGRWIASGGECGEVLVLDAATGGLVHELEGDTKCGRVAFSADGASLAAVGTEVLVWDVASGRLRARWPSGSPTALAWSPDALHLAYVGARDTVSVLAASDLTVLHELEAPGEVAHLVWSPDSRRLELAANGRVRWFDLAAPGPAVTATFPGRLCATDWLADGRSLRLDADGVLHGLALDPSFLLHGVVGMAAGNDGELVVAWSRTQTVGHDASGSRFELEGGGPAAVRTGTSWLRAIGGELQFLRDREVLRHVPLPHRHGIDAGVLTADGRHVAITAGDLGIHAFDAGTGARIGLPAGVAGAVLPNRAGPELLLWSAPEGGQDPGEGSLTWWSLTSLRAGHVEPIRTVRLRDVPTGAPRLGGDGRWIAFGGAMFDLDVGGAPQWTVGGPPFSHAIPGEGGRQAIVLRLRDGLGWGGPHRVCVELLERDGTARPVAEDRGQPEWVDFSPDGELLAWVTHDRLEVLRTRTLERVGDFAADWAGTGAWVDGEHLLQPGTGPLRVDLCTSTRVVATLPLRRQAHGVSVDRAGRRAIVVLPDRVSVLRLQR